MDGRVRRGIRFALGRVTIELTSPMRVGTGGGDDTRDSLFVTDANGLPAVPGTSIAGILRHRIAGRGDPAKDPRCRAAFGYQEGDRGRSSAVEVSWGQVHGHKDRPVPFAGANTDEDALLRELALGATRDHVRLSQGGVVDGTGKFDETAVLAGARFTLELVVHDHDEEAKGGREPSKPVTLQELVTLLNSPTTRLGGSSRRGLGAFRVVRAEGREFDLARGEDRKAFAALPRELHVAPPKEVGMRDLAANKEGGRCVPGILSLSLELHPEDYWIIGHGEPDQKRHRADNDHLVDMVPLEEKRVVWEGTVGKERGAVQRSVVVPGSGIKGALRHRTEFHLRRRRGVFAGAADFDEKEEMVQRAAESLFGSIKRRERDPQGEPEAGRGGRRQEDVGSPGRLFVSDATPAKCRENGRLHHVTLDRFSGGAMDGHLFTEAPLWKGELRVQLALEERGVDETARAALDDAIRDLCEGRLAIGGGGNRGHGYVRGPVRTFNGEGNK